MAGPPPPAALHPHRRRILLIKRRLQFRIVGLVLAGILLGAVVIGVSAASLLGRFLAREYLTNPQALELVARMARTTGLQLSMLLVVVAGIGVYLSHRIAGPLYRFQKTAEILSTGDLTARIRLRQRDELLDVAEDLNRMIASLQARVGRDRARARAVEGQILDLVGRLKAGPGDRKSVEACAQELLDVKETVAKLTSEFLV